VDELQELYREVILDHNRRPRNFGELPGANHVIEAVNPLCGDKLTLYVNVTDGRVADIRFKGSGCAISVASSSLMTERVKGQTIGESLELFEKVHDLLTGAVEEPAEDLDKLAALAGVRDYPTRVKCRPRWHALKTAVSGHDQARRRSDAMYRSERACDAHTRRRSRDSRNDRSSCSRACRLHDAGARQQLHRP
jgi:nitrogen fixation NifU-like protein